jgi:hypothetical protein
MKSWISTFAAGLFCLLAVQVGATTAATDTSGESSTEAFRGRVVIHCQGRMRFGPPGPAGGRCTVSGAFTDRGWFVDSDLLHVHPHVRTLRLRKGTIEFSVYRERGHWRIIKGTKAYAGLRGRGWESLSAPCCPRRTISLTMTGTVSQ